MYVCENLLLGENLSLSTAHLRPSGFTGYIPFLHGALRGPRGAPRKQLKVLTFLQGQGVLGVNLLHILSCCVKGVME